MGPAVLFLGILVWVSAQVLLQNIDKIYAVIALVAALNIRKMISGVSHPLEIVINDDRIFLKGLLGERTFLWNKIVKFQIRQLGSPQRVLVYVVYRSTPAGKTQTEKTREERFWINSTYYNRVNEAEIPTVNQETETGKNQNSEKDCSLIDLLFEKQKILHGEKSILYKLPEKI